MIGQSGYNRLKIVKGSFVFEFRYEQTFGKVVGIYNNFMLEISKYIGFKYNGSSQFKKGTNFLLGNSILLWSVSTCGLMEKVIQGYIVFLIKINKFITIIRSKNVNLRHIRFESFYKTWHKFKKLQLYKANLSTTISTQNKKYEKHKVNQIEQNYTKRNVYAFLQSHNFHNLGIDLII